jgi:glycosyltransferase involved in cell wall biosynthesis
MPDATLLVAGEGPQREALASLAARKGVGQRVRFLGAVPQAQLVEYYNAADILVLASTREGWPNVLLESLACGTPAVAAAVGGCSEIVNCPAAGALFHGRDPQALAQTLVHVRARGLDRAAARRHAEQYSWSDTSRGLLSLMRTAAGEERRVRIEESFSSSAANSDVLRPGRRH